MVARQAVEVGWRAVPQQRGVAVPVVIQVVGLRQQRKPLREVRRVRWWHGECVHVRVCDGRGTERAGVAHEGAGDGSSAAAKEAEADRLARSVPVVAVQVDHHV
eukprot:3913958-Prymnesium_polylepis.2